MPHLSSSLVVHHQLNTEGLICPEPLMLLHKVMRKAQSGEVVYMRATDPSTTRDVVKFCTHLQHTLLQQSCDAALYEYWIEKK